MSKITIKRPDIAKGSAVRFQYYANGIAVGEPIGRGEAVTFEIPTGVPSIITMAAAIDPRVGITKIMIGSRKFSEPKFQVEIIPTEPHHLYEVQIRMKGNKYAKVF